MLDVAFGEKMFKALESQGKVNDSQGELNGAFVRLHRSQLWTLTFLGVVLALSLGWNLILSHQVKKLWEAQIQSAKTDLDLLANQRDIIETADCNRYLVFSLWDFVDSSGSSKVVNEPCNF